MRPTPGFCGCGKAQRRSTHLSEQLVDVAAAADPVAAVLDAHREGHLIALRTSGTSGHPRAVLRTTESWFCSFEHVTSLLAMDGASRVWVPGALSSTMNLFAAVHAAHLGAEVSADLNDATHAVLTPAALTHLLAGDTRLGGQHLVVAGDGLTRRLRDQAVAAGASQVSHYYGAAELSFVAWGPHRDALAPFPGCEVHTRHGEIWVRSSYLCRGYSGPAGPLRLDDEGWASVGDRGWVSDGLVRLVGRGDDTVVTAGATVFVGEVEEELERATGTRPVVVGVPHPDLGEVLCGLLPRADLADRVRLAARRVLPPASRPRRWYVAETTPTTAAGKVDRRGIVTMLTDDEGRARRV